MIKWKRHFFFSVLLCVSLLSEAQKGIPKTIWEQPPQASKPWTFWYWMHGAVTKEGITADLEEMAKAGLGGAYLMPIKGPTNPPHIPHPVMQLTPEWWTMIRHSFAEANRLRLHLGMHISDGFALAGGPWITPDLSMQKLVWTKTTVKGGRLFNDSLSQPEVIENYYRDVAIYAYPAQRPAFQSTQTMVPRITSSKNDSAARFLSSPQNKRTFGCDDNCWIQYEFEQPFTCRSIVIKSRNNYQANRLIMQVSDDGQLYKTVLRLNSPRHGWQDWDADYTHAVPATTSRYFRFVFDKDGSEPGAEDLDAAKWKPSLRITGIELSEEPIIDGYEGKSGKVWRISAATTREKVSLNDCVPSRQIIDLTSQFKQDKLQWNAPDGEWIILRLGHTSTGHRNETGGGGKGLECDKFNASAITLQFNKWFGEVYKQVDPAILKNVLRYLHIDSWECGSQNWSSNFMEEFLKRRGYDLKPYLPVMAGVPVDSIEKSEKILLDVRTTIADLINDIFFKTLSSLAKTKGVQLSAESVAPTMISDGMLHYKTADVPMGEFWLRSPTHDKPNDMIDAVSGAHIYGKNIIQAESFTQLRMAWDEHPAILKPLLDRNYALGINRIFFHVFIHNPWLNRKPGFSLDAIGLFFQRDQTWWKQANAFVSYAGRCQALLQLGRPVTDIAIFTGEDIPRRSILPDRLIDLMPGIFGEGKLNSEKERLNNKGQPMRQLPAGVNHSANMADPEDWIDPLNGYAYDSYNKDALLNLSGVKNGRLQLNTGAEYSVLIIPGATKMSPNKNMLSDESAQKLRQLINGGITVMLPREEKLIKKLVGDSRFKTGDLGFDRLGKGRIVYAPYKASTFDVLGLQKDFVALEVDGRQAQGIAWTKRKGDTFDIYFISNQKDSARQVNLSLRVNGKIPEIWDPLSGSQKDAGEWQILNGRTHLPVFLEKYASLFIVLQKSTTLSKNYKAKNWNNYQNIQTINQTWRVKFDNAFGGPSSPVIWNVLQDWSKIEDSSIRYYSGAAIYETNFSYQHSNPGQQTWLNVGTIANVAEVFLNGKACGVIWTAPFRVEITKAIKPGNNELKIILANTWANRLIGDQQLPKEKRVSFTTYPFNMQGKSLLPAGLLGPVFIETVK
jgi:hypothetical protein